MNLKHRKKNPINAKDRQRRLIRTSHIRILLTVTFIVNLLVVFRLIQPGQHSLLVEQLNTLIPTLKGSVLFFLALAAASLGGLVWYGAGAELSQPQEQKVHMPLSNVATSHNGKIVPFDPKVSPESVMPLHQVTAHA